MSHLSDRYLKMDEKLEYKGEIYYDSHVSATLFSALKGWPFVAKRGKFWQLSYLNDTYLGSQKNEKFTIKGEIIDNCHVSSKNISAQKGMTVCGK